MSPARRGLVRGLVNVPSAPWWFLCISAFEGPQTVAGLLKPLHFSINVCMYADLTVSASREWHRQISATVSLGRRVQGNHGVVVHSGSIMAAVEALTTLANSAMFITFQSVQSRSAAGALGLSGAFRADFSLDLGLGL
jgi:hypothetical protein